KVKVSAPPFTAADAVPRVKSPVNANSDDTSPGLANPAGSVTALNDPAVYVTGLVVVGLPCAVRFTVNGLAAVRFARLSVPAGAPGGLTVSLSAPATGAVAAA